MPGGSASFAGSKVELAPGSYPEEKSGCRVSKVTGLIMAILVIICLVAVGLIVYYAVPANCDEQVWTTLAPDVEWDNCLALADEKGYCVEECPSTGTTEAMTTVAPTVEPLPTGLRLNKSFIPLHYNVELTPRFYGDDSDFGFNGKVEMWVECKEALDVITMHVDTLTIWDGTLKVSKEGGDEMEVTHSLDTPRHFLHLHFQDNLEVGETYYITMQFNGTHLHSDLWGFYLSDYQEDGETKYLVTTQFQRTHARRAFPCFDEPSFKSYFNITLVRRSTHVSLSNMEIISQEDRENDMVADVYNTTVLMSPYLLAFVVCEFEQRNTTTSRGTMIRIWSRPAYLDQMDFSLDISTKILEAFEDYTGIPFPLSKTDQIAIPDFAAGAMENWGLVTYRERGLLWNPEYSTMGQKRYIAAIISHEFAHFWFGNLVTCDWWDDTWLNEGFANFMADFMVSRVMETWRMNEYYMVTVEGVMVIDGNSKSQPIFMAGLEHHDELYKAFSSITYRKGGSVIRMMQYFLTPDTFQRALGVYLERYAYSTVVHANLYEALEEQAYADGTVTWDKSTYNFTDLIETWIDQQNYPVLNITTQGGGEYKLTQEVFRYDPSIDPAYESDFGFRWHIPLTFANAADLEAGDQNGTLQWIYMNDGETTLSGLSDPWALVNVFTQGFYRVQYDDATWDAIIEQLNTDHTVFPHENRGQLIDDSLNFVRANRWDEVKGWKITQYMKRETEYLPWYGTLYTRLPYLINMLYGSSTYEHLQTYMLDLLSPAYTYVTWDNSNPDEHIEKYTRSMVLQEACGWEHTECVQEAQRLFNAYMNDSTDLTIIEPDFRSNVYCMGVKYGGIKAFNFMLERFYENVTEYTSTEKSTILSALACSREAWILRKYMDLAVAWNNEDGSTALYYLSDEVNAHPTLWDFLMEMWDVLPAGYSKQEMITGLTMYYSTEHEKSTFETFIENYPDDRLTGFYQSRLAFIETNIKWMATNQQNMEDWLVEINTANTLYTGQGPAAAAATTHTEEIHDRSRKTSAANLFSEELH